MLIFSLVTAILAALVHCYIFYLESIAWKSPRTAQIFKFSSEQLSHTRELAFNQGFYNLFLSLLVFIGTALLFFNQSVAGLTLIFAGLASMFAAALVLALGSPSRRSLAARQGTLPLLSLLLLVIYLVL